MVSVGQWQDDTQTCADLRTISSYPSPDTDLNTNAQAYPDTDTDPHSHADRYPLTYPSPDTDSNTNAQAYPDTDPHSHADRYPLTYPDATGRSWGTGRRFDSSGSGDCD